MKINNSNSPNFKGGIYTSNIFKKSLLFASNNSPLFCSGVSLALSSVARPLAISMTPGVDSENKKHAIAKSISSSLVGYLLMFLVSSPFTRAVRNIDENPFRYLKNSTIENLKGSVSNLNSSKKYKFATQLFKLGLGILIAIPKSNLTSYLIPKVLKLSKKFKKEEKSKQDSTNLSFKGDFYNSITHSLSKKIGSAIDSKAVLNLSNKLYKTNFERGMMFLSDFVLTGAFVKKTLDNDEIEEKRKKPLIYNSVIATFLSTISSLAIDNVTKKPFEKFALEFVKQNKNSKNLDKYLEGLKIAKISLIIGSVYYILIPVISTFFADKLDNCKNQV